MFVFSFPFVNFFVGWCVCLFVLPSVNLVELKVSQVAYISITTYQKAFIFGPQSSLRVRIHIMTQGGAGGQNLVHLLKVLFCFL